MAFDGNGRLFVSSDDTGEIYVVEKDTTSSGTASTTGSAQPTPTSSGEQPWVPSFGALVFALIAFCLTI